LAWALTATASISAAFAHAVLGRFTPASQQDRLKEDVIAALDVRETSFGE
jgi:hypothetical protein